MVTNKERWFHLKEAADFPVFTDVDDAMKAWHCLSHTIGEKTDRFPADN